ncbi:hypothetical protein [Streptomyces sp. NBC_01217]|uniref:hypothetical protein n=1 Tax=Streptomyces sp. NBC_01217 TaxID=2903779 RepID=UPI002E13FCAA|nr:hypothetical protein OG507_20960 [Streptomyces sp. NBC_01217]
MARVYANPEQYTAWTGQPAPAGVERLLARASQDIDTALLTAVYDTDSTGTPTDPDIVATLADATCAQVEYQQATGDDGTGAAGQWDSVSIGPVSMSGRRARPQAAGDLDLAPRAGRVLAAAGLLPGVIW